MLVHTIQSAAAIVLHAFNYNDHRCNSGAMHCSMAAVIIIEILQNRDIKNQSQNKHITV